MSKTRAAWEVTKKPGVAGVVGEYCRSIGAFNLNVGGFTDGAGAVDVYAEVVLAKDDREVAIGWIKARYTDRGIASAVARAKAKAERMARKAGIAVPLA